MVQASKRKWSRYSVGSICKSQDKTKPDYLKLRGGDSAAKLAEALSKADSKKGISLSLESKERQLKQLDESVSAGKLSEELAVKIKERIEKIPDYVRFEVVLTEKL